MKALKLIWLSDRYHINTTSKLITGDTYVAMKNGTVASATRDILEENSNFMVNEEEISYAIDFIKTCEDRYQYNSKQDINNKVFSKNELRTLNLIYDNYGKFNETELSDISHEFEEWKKHEDTFNSGIASRVIMDIADFFTQAPANHSIFDIDKDIIELSKEFYEDDKQINDILFS